MTVLNEGADAANTTATTAVMGVGDYFFGTLDTTADSDWIEVTLVAGQTYTFGLVGVGALSDSMSDPYLRLRSTSGAEIQFDDDDGPGRNSSITFIADRAGTYYLDAQSWNNTQAGDYGLSMVEGTRASFDVTMGAGNLIRSDASWASAPATAVTVTWSIRTSGSEPSGGNPFVAPSAAQIGAIDAVMDYIAGVSGLTFTQVNEGGTSNDATMVFGAYDANDGSGAYAYYPGSTDSSANAGDVWLNNNSGSTTSLPIGSYSYFVLLHEIGHALGLAHPGDYNAAPGVSITYANNAQFIEDSHQYTVMSYFDESNTTTSVGGYPDTLLLHDLLAIHQQYGADMTFHAGNTIYGFNATVGGAYDFNTNTNPLLSIWDGIGNDTIDLSGYAMAQVLNLTAGTFSNVGGFLQNLSIAIGAVIENAIGGSGNDEITGNDVNNRLQGGAGEDTLNGGEGNDTVLGGFGIDVIRGGIGHDSLGGGQQNDTLYGEDGNDWIHGGQHNDSLIGGAGDDTLNGGLGNDTASGGIDSDLIMGGIGHDSLGGGQQNDTLYGEDGNDWIHGGQHDDSLDGGAGNDTLNGGTGNDTVKGGIDSDLIRGGTGHDSLGGGQQNDTLYGEGGDDWMHGGQHNDILDGGAGNDTLNGGVGDDTVTGGADDDDLYGHTGNDTFVFGNGFGTDTIHDFDATNDLEQIDLSAVSAITDLADLVADHMSQVGSNVLIDDLAGNVITLVGVDLNDLLDGNDFLF
ncbi:MAG: M10 family metallopeptidase C-terminal domain-containing protein [Sulfitobacter sp.]